MSVATVQAEALALPAGERARLIDVLWNSPPAPVAKSREPAWAAESERRIDAFAAGNLTARDAADVLYEMLKR